MAVQQKIHIDEFEDFINRPENSERRFELIDGEIVEKMPTEEHGVVTLNIGSEVRTHVRQNNLGRVAVEARHRGEDDEYNDRIPDISFTSAERALPLTKQGAVPQMPDLAVEVKSPTDSIKGMREKANYYLKNGARMVWLVFPQKQLVEVYRPDADVEILNADDTLDGGDVLPGFALAVKDIFAE